MTEAMKISCRDATINALKEEIAGLNKHRKKIQTENKQLKAYLKKAKCCGSCKWYVEERNTYVCFKQGSVMKKPWSYCDKWEDREL